MVVESNETNSSSGSLRYYWVKLSQQAYIMARVFGLKRFQEFMQGSTPLAPAPACLLGKQYGIHNPDDEAPIDPEVLELLMQDFKSRLWFTYRKDIPPLGESLLTTDSGWGCTIRTGQMLLAEALMRCRLGRDFCSMDMQQQPEALLKVLSLFQDSPDSSHPLSIHHICQQGAPSGVVVGQWLGPWVLCKALEVLLNQHQDVVGLRVHVVCDPGGGAPCLVPARVRALFTGQVPTGQPHQRQGGDQPEGSEAPADHTAAEAATPPVAAEGGEEQDNARAQQPDPLPLLLMLPLTLGLDKANPRYFPHLKAVLTYPQSVGIVGGRPGSSLYFVGYQDDNLIHLDPHFPQPPATLPQDLPTFFCPSPRLTPLSSIDPSLAIGFVCRTLEELDDLCSRLENLESQAEGAPLLTLGSGDSPDAARSPPESLDELGSGDEEPAGTEGAGEWELV